MSHTPTPWIAKKDYDGSIYIESNDCYDLHPFSVEDADHIVRCVNAHEKLIQTLRHVSSILEIVNTVSRAEKIECTNAVDLIDEALNAATGESK